MRVADPTDGRARVIQLTARGKQLESTINAQAQAAEMQIAKILGPRSFDHLHRTLELLAERFTEVTKGNETSRSVDPE